MRSLSMVHTLGMQSLWRRVGQGILLAVLASGASGDSAQADRAMPGRPSEKESWQKAASLAAGLTPDARVLVLEIDSGRLLASRHLAEASQTLATPGSTLKPLILYFALASGDWSPDRRVACLRKMHIGNHQLNCSHPAADPMDAVQALTWSCNSYFAELAGSLTPEELHRALMSANFWHSPALQRKRMPRPFDATHQGANSACCFGCGRDSRDTAGTCRGVSLAGD